MGEMKKKNPFKSGSRERCPGEVGGEARGVWGNHWVQSQTGRQGNLASSATVHVQALGSTLSNTASRELEQQARGTRRREKMGRHRGGCVRSAQKGNSWFRWNLDFFFVRQEWVLTVSLNVYRCLSCGRQQMILNPRSEYHDVSKCPWPKAATLSASPLLSLSISYCCFETGYYSELQASLGTGT